MLNSTDKIIIGYYNSSFYIDSSIFKLINYLIINNPNNNENILLILKKVVINSLEKIEDNFYGQENVICTLLLIICWLIVQPMNNNKISNNNEISTIVINIISIILKKLNKLIENNKLESDEDNKYLEYFYLVIIFCSFIYYSNYTFSLIYDNNALNSLINCVNNNVIISKTFFSLKLNKLFIFGLSKILYENDFLKLILINFKDAFILNYNLISKQLSEETKESKIKNKINDLDLNDNDNPINEINYLTKKIYDIMTEFILPKIEFDEYEIFNTVYKKLIEINETKAIIGKIMEEMDESTKNDFKNILLVKKINIIKDNNINDISDENTEETIHRRIVKIKKK